MIKRIILFFFLPFVWSCTNKKSGPDVSGIQIELKLDRFDRDFIGLDTNNILQGLDLLQKKYPVLTPIFIHNILGLDSAGTIPGIRRFISMSGRLFDTVHTVFNSTKELEKEFFSAFRYLKFYFPKYPLPSIATVAGPVDALAQSDAGPTPNFLAPGVMGISLQFYLGKNFSVYQDPFYIEQVAPSYRSRRFSKEYIISDALSLIISDLFPYTSGGLPLVEQMVEKGKRWWLLEQLLPAQPDSVKTGYTEQQLKWCRENEGLIWTYIIKNEDLYSLNPTTLQTYLGEGPFTQGFNQELSPGNLGQWIGWQIVKKYMLKNNKTSPAELMALDPKKILEEAKYKPK